MRCRNGRRGGWRVVRRCGVVGAGAVGCRLRVVLRELGRCDEVVEPEVAEVVVESVIVGDSVELRGAVDEFEEGAFVELGGSPVEGEAASWVVVGSRGAQAS